MRPTRCIPQMLVLTALLAPALVAQRPAATAPRLEQLTRAQFDALPADQLVEVRGKAVSKRDLLALASQRSAEAKARSEAESRQRDAAMQTAQAAFEQQENARLEQKRLRVRADAARVTQADGGGDAIPEAIRVEARQLRTRMAQATTDAERQAIHLRAQQLLAQLPRP